MKWQDIWHLCPVGDAAYWTVCSTDCRVPVQSAIVPVCEAVCHSAGLSAEGWKTGIHIQTQVWKIHYYGVSPNIFELDRLFIHAFSIFTRGYCEADVLAQTTQDRATHSHSHLWAISSLQFAWHVFVRMRGKWNTWRKPTQGNSTEALKRFWFWPLLSVTDFWKP